MLVEVTNALFGYGVRPVVQVDDLSLHAGRCVGVFGPNGAGKTTLIRGITGLLAPLSGSVLRGSVADEGGAGCLRDSDPLENNAKTSAKRGDSSGSRESRDQARAIRFAYMPQHRAMELHWPMSGLDAAAMATSARRRFGWMGGCTPNVLAMMRKLNVEDLARRPFAKLSGGQQQRILLAGAMASQPDVLVLDEPTDGLDLRSTRMLLDLLREFTAAGLCTVIISHEVEDLLYVCDDVAWLHPAESQEQPSRVEMIAPTALVARVAGQRQ